MGRRAAVLLAALLGAATAAAAPAPSPPAPDDPVLGRWLTQDRDGVFAIYRCGDTICGRLVGVRIRDHVPVDKHGRPQCGQQLLYGFQRGGDPGHWRGWVLDPDDEHSYGANVWSPSPGILKLRGYVGLPIFGETQQWTRYDGPIGPECRLPGGSASTGVGA